MTWQRYKEEWTRLHTCRFCPGSHMHTCTSFRCRPAQEKAEEYFETVVAKEEVMAGRRKYVADLTAYSTADPANREIVEGVWMMSDNRKKELVIQFRETVPEMQQAAYARIAACSLSRRLADEEKQRGKDSAFCKMTRGARIRLWGKEDEETVKQGIPIKWEKDAAGRKKDEKI